MKLFLPLASIPLLLAACGDSSTSSIDSGIDGNAASDSGPSDSAAPDAAPEAFVEFLIEPPPLTIDGDLAFDYAWQYRVVLPDDPTGYSLMVERCMEQAGEAEICSPALGAAVEGEFLLRFGIDPSQYNIGVNHYRMKLTLLLGSTIVSTDMIDLVATVNSCITCGP